MWSVFVYKTFWRKILLLQENILQKNEYQYKNSYKCCNSKNIYGPWYLEGTINSYTKYLFDFNLFDKKIIKKY